MSNQLNTYKETIDFMYQTLPEFSRQGSEALRNNLDNITALCKAAGDPQNKFISIHVAGTNGKGSTCHSLSAIFQECGYKTGLYTSPHLLDFRERIRIDGKEIEEQQVVDFINKYRTVIDEIKPSFFEVATAMAFVHFAEAEVEMAIIETGLGGTYDATNIITPIISLITNISYDHMNVFGDSLEEIATQKAGIIKKDVPVVLAEQPRSVQKVIENKAAEMGSRIYDAAELWDVVRYGSKGNLLSYKVVQLSAGVIHNLYTDLQGRYQQHNLRLILATIEVLPTFTKLKLNLGASLKALGRVKATTGFRGRWEILQRSPLIVADVAHNVAGIRSVLLQFNSISSPRKHIICGFSRDKDVEEAMTYFPRMHKYYYCRAESPRAMAAEELAEIGERKGLEGAAYPSVEAAINAARTVQQKGEAILITGSFYVVAEALAMNVWELDKPFRKYS